MRNLKPRTWDNLSVLAAFVLLIVMFCDLAFAEQCYLPKKGVTDKAEYSPVLVDNFIYECDPTLYFLDELGQPVKRPPTRSCTDRYTCYELTLPPSCCTPPEEIYAAALMIRYEDLNNPVDRQLYEGVFRWKGFTLEEAAVIVEGNLAREVQRYERMGAVPAVASLVVDEQCSPSVVISNPGQPVQCGKFPSWWWANHQYHHLLNHVMDLGAEINVLEPGFGVAEDFGFPLTHANMAAYRETLSCNPDVESPCFEVEPGVFLRPYFDSHAITEQKHISGETTVFQYVSYIAFLNEQNMVPEFPFVDCGPMEDGRFIDFVYKPLGDATALCAGVAVAGGEAPLNVDVAFGKTGVLLFDVYGNQIGDGWYKGRSNGNRPFYCLSENGQSLYQKSQGLGMWVMYITREQPYCGKFVTDPRNRED